MKKLVLTSVCAVAFTGAALAQGTINWGSISFSGFTAETNTTTSSFLSSGGSSSLQGGSTGLTTTVAGSYYYELLYNTSAGQQAAPTTLAALDNWVDTGLEGDNGATAGRASTTAATTSSDATVPFTTAASFMLVGWSSNLGTSWSAVSTVLNSPTALASVVGPALFGESTTGYITPNAAGVSPGATLFGTSAGEIHSLLTPLEPITTPEPTSIALGVMGAASLLALRRKKA